MPERDYVEETLTVAHSGVFDFNSLYQAMKKWFKQYKYNLQELDYKDRKEDGIRKLKIKWQAKRKISDYVRYVIQTTLEINNFSDVLVEKKKRAKGDLKITSQAYLEKDYEETWYRSSFIKFMREVYDKFAQGSQFDAMEKELKQEVNKLVHEIKVHLNLLQPRD